MPTNLERSEVKYRCEILANETNASFLVCLVIAPNFPDDKPVKEGIRIPYRAVIAATDSNKPRSFIALTADQKECIGGALVDAKVHVNVWMHCELEELF